MERFCCCCLDKERKYLGDIFDNVPKQQSNNSVEFEWSETPHLPTYSLPLVKDGIVVGYVCQALYVLFCNVLQTSFVAGLEIVLS